MHLKNFTISGVLVAGVRVLGPVLASTAAACCCVSPVTVFVSRRAHSWATTGAVEVLLGHDEMETNLT